jgi:hypothetical protein
MKRREFIALMGAGGLLLAAKVMRARAEQPVIPVIGFLNSQSPGVYAPMAAAFHGAEGPAHVHQTVHLSPCF